MKYSDEELREAFVSLESSTPDGYFDQFSDRVASRLEVEAMQGPDVVSPDKSSSAPPPTPEREENSGLHEIRELATTAKKRIRRRRTTESDVEESLLQASTSGLHAVVLPEPGKETAPALASAEPAPASEASAAAPREPETRRSLWVYGALGAVAAAAAIVAVVFLTRGGAGEEVARGEENAPAEATSAPDQAPASAPAAEGSEPKVESLGGGGAAGAAGSSGGAEGDEPEAGDEPGALAADPEEKDEAAEPAAESEEPKVARRGAAAKRRGARERRARKRSGRKEEAASKSEPAKEAESEPAESEEAESASEGEGEDVDDILTDVTGGVDESGGGEAQEAKPKKKELDRSDVARAMRAVRGRAGKCYEKEEVTGTVSVRFTVKPSGKLSRVHATGEHNGTPTGKCVAAAVKSASFPAYDGRPMTFTFPFLLAP